MAIARRHDAFFRTVIFDLDEALLDRVPAWEYTVEQAVLSVTGERVEPRALSAEYHTRPWRHALEVLVREPSDVEACNQLCDAMFRRSALKRLLVQEGLGMALDRLRGARMEMGAISRERHSDALRQVQSTGLDRFVTVLAATPDGEPWALEARVNQCLKYVEQPAGRAAFVSGHAADLRAADTMGLSCYAAGWLNTGITGFPVIASPARLDCLLAAAP